MQNKTVIVTGATAGMGLVTARELAQMGASVTLVGRNTPKLSTVAEQIKTQSGNLRIETVTADLSTLAGVQKVAHEFKKRHTHLDVLINNVGAMYMTRQITVDNLEQTFALNHLASFHLTILLLDVLKASTAGRIVNVSSDSHRNQVIDFDNLQGEKEYNGYAIYGRTKMMNIIFTYELARRLEGTKVTVNALHPGFVATNFAQNNSGMMSVAMKLARLFAKTPEKGAETGIYLASSPQVQGVSGKYFHEGKVAESDPGTYDSALAEKLWNTSLELIAGV